MIAESIDVNQAVLFKDINLPPSPDCWSLNKYIVKIMLIRLKSF